LDSDSKSPFPFPPFFSCGEKDEGRDFAQHHKKHIFPERKLEFSLLGIKKKDYKLNKILLF